MLTSKEIRNVKFSNSMGGYKKEEVDILLDKIEVDYDRFEKKLAEHNAEVEELKAQIESLKNSQSSIQNVLVSAQKLADQIVEEAKEKSKQIVSDAENSIQEITDKERELTAAFEQKASVRKEALDKSLNEVIEKGKEKYESVSKATEDSVLRQQTLFDRLKLETAAFKADILNRYKEQIALISKIPDIVPMSPEQAAKALSSNFEEIPDIESFLNKKADEAEKAAKEVAQKEVKAEGEEKNEPVKETAKEAKSGVFVIKTDALDDMEDK